MTKQQKKSLACELGILSIFRGILNTKPITALLDFLRCEADAQTQTTLFGNFVYSLSDDNYCFSDFLCRSVFSDENKYIISAAQKTDIPKVILKMQKQNLNCFRVLQSLLQKTLRIN